MHFFTTIDLITTSWPAYSNNRWIKEILIKIKSNAGEHSMPKPSKDLILSGTRIQDIIQHTATTSHHCIDDLAMWINLKINTSITKIRLLGSKIPLPTSTGLLPIPFVTQVLLHEGLFIPKSLCREQSSDIARAALVQQQQQVKRGDKIRVYKYHQFCAAHFTSFHKWSYSSALVPGSSRKPALWAARSAFL